MIQWLVGVDRDFCQVIRLQVDRQPDRHSSGAALEKNLLEVHVNRLLSPLAVGAAAWLLVACGGDEWLLAVQTPSVGATMTTVGVDQPIFGHLP